MSITRQFGIFFWIASSYPVSFPQTLPLSCLHPESHFSMTHQLSKVPYGTPKIMAHHRLYPMAVDNPLNLHLNILLVHAGDQVVVSTTLHLLLGKKTKTKKQPRYMAWQERARNVVFAKRQHLTSTGSRDTISICYLLSTPCGPITFL